MTSGKNNTLASMGTVAGTVKYALQYAVEDEMQMAKLRASVQRNTMRKFIPYVNALAVADPSAFHHVYEWRKPGVTAARLFELVDAGNQGRGKTEISLVLAFKPSVTRVPLTEAQEKPGKDGVKVKGNHKFPAKAYVMEYHIPVKIRPRSAKKLAFQARADSEKLIFTSREIRSPHPGGMKTRNAMRTATQQFFRSYGTQISGGVMTKYISDINKKIGARVGRMGKVTVAVPNMNDARSIGREIARSVNP